MADEHKSKGAGQEPAPARRKLTVGDVPPPPCPKCGSTDTEAIWYGMPSKDRPKGVCEGGCMFDVDTSPGWHCKACHARFGTMREVFEAIDAMEERDGT